MLCRADDALRVRYNIIYEWQKTSMMAVQGDFEAARNLLLDELGAVAAMRGWTVTVSPWDLGSRPRASGTRLRVAEAVSEVPSRPRVSALQ